MPHRFEALLSAVVRSRIRWHKRRRHLARLQKHDQSSWPRLKEQDIKINRQIYAQAMGGHAPCELMYELKPEDRRFVALAGVDENVISFSNGSNLAKYPSVVFKVFVDGKEGAASPVSPVSTLAWRFDVRTRRERNGSASSRWMQGAAHVKLSRTGPTQAS